MMARGTATSKLLDVMQMLQMTHKTGALLVNRDGINNVIEQGAIYLQHGQIIDASLGTYRGAEALRRLQGWQSCYFVFQALAQPGGSVDSRSSLPSTQMSPTKQSPVTGGYGSGPLSTPYNSGSNAPQRIREVNEILPHFNRLGLTRMHRQLFLLIDGQRTVPEIIRLMGHRTDEVNILLADLERTGLIRW